LLLVLLLLLLILGKPAMGGQHRTGDID